eukprot:gene1832-2004_t
MIVTRSIRSGGITFKYGCRGLSVETPSSSIPEDLEAFQKGRGRSERVDSVTLNMLEDRKRHHERMLNISPLPNNVTALEEQGFGRKRRLPNLYKHSLGRSPWEDQHHEATGAGGNVLHLASTDAGPWPIFKHMLPEIAFAGHSNSGKSTLVNAMVGVPPRTGPAKVSDRAGWTDQICFYQLGKKPPIFTLVDLPGYGHAIAEVEQKKGWKVMIRDYLSNRPVLARCFVLVDCSRGLCDQDYTFLRFLYKRKIDWGILMTKCDLLSAEDLEKSRIVIAQDLARFGYTLTSSLPNQPEPSENHLLSAMDLLLRGDRICLVSASTGAGVNKLFETLCRTAHHNAVPFQVKHGVREHVLAAKLRADQSHKDLTPSKVTISSRLRKKLK